MRAMHAIRVCAVGLAIIVPASLANAAFATGNDLFDECTKPSGISICYGYVAGVADAMMARDGELLGWRTCIREGVSGDQIKDATVHFIRTHIEIRDAGAASLVAHALAETFPCGR
jgi:hypothetical protein